MRTDVGPSPLLFRKLSKTAMVGGSTKSILDEVSGEVLGGDMMAVLGASGSGKTTLLEICGGRNLQDVTGNVFIDGAQLKKHHRRCIAFVTQEDVFFESDKLTVRDMLDFSIAMRWPSSTQRDKKVDEVDRVLILLDLVKAANSPICLVSGGERRRLSIGCELLCPSPRLAVIDEGTSGLDSSSASKVIKTLRGVSKAKKIPILVAIHQPSLSVFCAFDNVLFLSDGHPIYYGSPHRVINYLHSVGFTQYGPGLNLIAPEFAQSLLSIKNYDEDEITFAFESPRTGLDPVEEKILPKDILLDAFDKEAYQERFSGDCARERGREAEMERDTEGAWSLQPREESKFDLGEPVVLGAVHHIDEAIRARHEHDAHVHVSGLEAEEGVAKKSQFTGEWKTDYPANWGTQFVAILRRSAKQQRR